MKTTVIAMALLLFSLISCRSGENDLPGDYHFTDPSIIGDYILPDFRDKLLREQKYTHLYQIKISIDRKSSFAEGRLEMSWYNGSGTDLDELRFRLLMNSESHAPMSILKIQAGDKELPFALSEDNTVLKVQLSGKLVHGSHANLSIAYAIDFSIHPTYYFDFARIDHKGFSIPHFYPVASRIKRGEWEEGPLYMGGDLLSADSSHYFVEVESDNDVVIVSSGKEIGKRTEGNSQTRAYVAGPVRDFYFCGLEDLKEAKGRAGETEISSFAPGYLKSASAKAVEITSYALSLFSREFSPYPFGELKVASLPMSALGVEFPGFFAINENLYREPEGFLFEPTVVHETAHQWFYSLLGNNQLRDPWIDEGLSQYAMWFYYKKKYGPSGGRGIYRSFVDRWERVSSEDIPINKEVAFYEGKEYASIIYGRGPLFFLDLSEVMGEESFHDFLRHLLEVYSHKNIDSETFLRELRDRGGSSVEPVIGEYFD